MKKIICLLLCALMCLPCFACGKVVEDLDPTKEHIFVKVFNGGMGTEWFEDFRQQFNSVNDKYDIVPRYQKQMPTEIYEDIKKNKCEDIYFNTSCAFQEGIYLNYFEDLSDLLDVKPDGANGRTVREKMIDYEDWQKMASKYGEGMYILPHEAGIMGMVFDYQVFVENEWLYLADEEDEDALEDQGITYTVSDGKYIFQSATGKVNYKQGDVLLKAGKDGKYGTYDDGQPTTVKEFDDMIKYITTGNVKAKAFVYAGTSDNYLTGIATAVMTQYMGEDMMKSYFTYDSNGEQMLMHDGTSKVITQENGYEVFKSEGLYQGLAFIDKYFNDANTVYGKSFATQSFSHTDAQNHFVLGFEESSGFPAILCEGTWWECEGKYLIFDKLVKEGHADRGYGKREYRFMLIPTLPGQAMAADESALNIDSLGGVVVTKQKSAEKLAKIKEFLLLTMTDENLAKFTAYSGTLRNYDYTLTEEQLAGITPFARNVYEMYRDTEHVKITRARQYKCADPRIFTSDMTEHFIPLLSGVVRTSFPIRFLRDYPLSTLYGNGINANRLGYSQADWNDYTSKARAQGFNL